MSSTFRVEIRIDEFVYRGDRDQKETICIVSGKGQTQRLAVDAAIGNLNLLGVPFVRLANEL